MLHELCQLCSPKLKFDEVDIYRAMFKKPAVPDYENDQLYTYDDFIRENIRKETEKFLPLIHGLRATSPHISATQYGPSHPAYLLAKPNVDVHVVTKGLWNFCRDMAFFCDDKTVVVAKAAEKATGYRGEIESQLLADAGFTLCPPLDVLLDDAGDLKTDANTLYLSTNFRKMRDDGTTSRKKVESEYSRLAKGRTIHWMPNGPLYHLDLYFSPLGNNSFAVGDLRAGRKILANNGIPLNEMECRAQCVDASLSFNDRQDILDSIAKKYAKTGKVFRVPLFSFVIGSHPFDISPVNLLSTDSKLIIPDHNIPGYDHVRQIFTEIGKHTGKHIIPIKKQGSYLLKDASNHCLVGNLQRKYK